MTAYTINLDPIVKLTREQFYELCAANPELKLERNANGELVIMSPTGGETGTWNSDITIDLGIWNRQTATGKILPLCPDFAIELLSPTDSWIKGLAKMQEYQDNGCRLGWLIDPESKRVAIYRLGQPVEILEAPLSLSGEDVLLGFVLNLENIWSSY